MRGDNIKSAKNNGKNEKKIMQLEELSWKQLDALDRNKTIVFIPMSPLEEHGPHLPLGTDFLTARDAAKETIRLISKKKPEYISVLFPPIPLGYAKMASDFPGTISTQVKTIKTIIFDICDSLAKFGFKYFVICTFHMALGHLKGIYSGMNKAMKIHSIHIIEPWGPYFYSKEVEKREPQVGFDTKKEVHACFRETSLMNYQYPYLVDPCYKDLQSIYRDLYSPRVLGKTFKELGINEGYVGSPARADSDYGRWYLQQIVETFTQATVDMLEGKNPAVLPSQTLLMMRSMFWLK
ncbi:MAG: creatininase family protein [Candidatus Thermoplasmatota archaeon]|nr:creatininase family protein [Candidatus Thermoplasmatota archaeon]